MDQATFIWILNSQAQSTQWPKGHMEEADI